MQKWTSGYDYLIIFLILFTLFSCSRQKGVKNIISKAENSIEQQPDSALQLLNTVLFPEDLSKSLFNKYNLLLLQAKDKNDKDIVSDTVIFAVKAYYVRKKDYPNAALAAFYCGRVWHEQKNTDKASEAYQEAGEWADKTKDYNLKGLIQGNWGILHREHSSYEKAIELNKNAVAMYDKAQNYRNKAGALKLIGDCFVLSEKIDSAFYYYNEGIALADSCKMVDLQLSIKNNMGVTYMGEGFYEPAKKLFNEALAFSNDSVEQARILLNIAQVYVLEDNMDSVNLYLDKALALPVSDPWLMRTSYLLRSKIEEKNNHYPEALKYYKEYYHSTINVFDSEKNNKLLEIQGKYDYEKLKNSQNRLIIKQQKILIILSLVLIVAGIIIFASYRRSAQNKRIMLDLEQKTGSLQKMADNFSKESYTFHNVLLEQFDILRKTALIRTLLSENEQASGQKLLRKFNEIVYGGDMPDWDKLYQAMDSLKNGLYNKIRSKYPQLSEMEFRICCLSCETSFNDTEIGVILETTTNMVRRIRSDLRKKLGMFKGEDFFTFFKEVIR
ncbi:hypothetical protein AGMMS50239_02380 [Bacteroidia bacterium]|nr:hypothetical protein AGMMS50239_02380 [Bacteroidia bacterium]